VLQSRVVYMKRTLGNGAAASLSVEVEASPPLLAPPPPTPPALVAADEEGMDLRRRSATPFTMFIAPDRRQLAGPAAQHHRACMRARSRGRWQALWDLARIQPRSLGSERSGDYEIG
jgi:hypothetical protein